MKSFLQAFSSVKLAIFLLIVIIAASILGTLVPQNRSPEAYQAKYGDFASLLMGLEITRLYQSWWYISFLILFGLNTLVCTYTRIIPKFKLVFSPKIAVPDKRIQDYREHERLKKPGKADEAVSAVKNILKSRHYRLKEETEENAHHILARKNLFGIFGSDIVHAGILIILLGGILSGIGRFRGNVNLIEGSTVNVPMADFQIRLDKFETEFYPSGAVKDWKSTLTVIDSGREAVAKTIEVNHPFSYGGFVFYQSSYGWDWNNPRLDILVKTAGEGSREEEIRLSIGETVTLQDGTTDVTALRFIPDFVIAEGNRVATRSLQPNNPAVYLESKRNSEIIFSGWIFAKFPDFSQMHTGDEKETAFLLENFHAPQYSGIQVAKDPGTNFIWIGSTLLMLGLFAAFYWPSRTLRFRLSASGSHIEILTGGESKKSREGLQKEFKDIISELRRSK
jgi:cytochrome c biogenesis protein